MATSLLATFAALDEMQREDLADLNSPRLLAFAALKLANEKCAIDQLSTEEITACLEAAGVAVRKLSISRALAGAHGYVSPTKGVDGIPRFRLMTKGRREIDAQRGPNRMSVMRIEQGQPRTARLMLADILSQAQGLTRICDPYFGLKTLESLDHISKGNEIRFLTCVNREDPTKIQSALRDFKIEHAPSDFRIAPTNAGLHDRYVVTNDMLLILGHGLKDIGGKESFVIRLDKSLAPDLIKSLQQSFDLIWHSATVI